MSIHRMLSPRSVAVIGASSDTDGLRGRIMHVMLGHPFAGTVYPVSRRESQILGRKAYRSVADLPETVDLAVLIIPARFVVEELQRCGEAGIKAAMILASGFSEEPGGDGAARQTEVRRIAQRYGMAINGPNSEGLANLDTVFVPTFSPVMEAEGETAVPLPARRARLAVIAQSGGMGFAFYDRAKPKGLDVRQIVTTGNEACLEASDYVEAMLDSESADIFLLLLEDIKTFATFERVAERALRTGKPLIVSKIGQSEPARRAALAHTAADAGDYADYRTMFARHGVIEGRDLDEMLDIASAFACFGDRLPASGRVGICTASGGGGGWLADACIATGLEIPLLDTVTRRAIDVHLPPYGTSQNPVDGTAQAIFSLGYAELARMVAASPVVDGIMVVASTRRAHTLERDREALAALARATVKPILFWSYTEVAPESVAVLNEAGFPLYGSMHNCARAMRALADYRVARERFMRT